MSAWSALSPHFTFSQQRKEGTMAADPLMERLQSLEKRYEEIRGYL